MEHPNAQVQRSTAIQQLSKLGASVCRGVQICPLHPPPFARQPHTPYGMFIFITGRQLTSLWCSAGPRFLKIPPSCGSRGSTYMAAPRRASDNTIEVSCSAPYEQAGTDLSNREDFIMSCNTCKTQPTFVVQEPPTQMSSTTKQLVDSDTLKSPGQVQNVCDLEA